MEIPTYFEKNMHQEEKITHDQGKKSYVRENTSLGHEAVVSYVKREKLHTLNVEARTGLHVSFKTAVA